MLLTRLFFSLEIPGDLYRLVDTTIATALRPFTLIKTDVEIVVKVNAYQDRKSVV